MNLAGLDLNLLLAFEALMEERGVTAAARRLGLRQPAMSAALARLRSLFRDDLFLRGAAGQGLRPTARALALAPGFGAALAIIRGTLAAALVFDPATATRRFALAATDYAAQVLLPELMRRIAAEAPDVAVQVIGYEKDSVAAMLEQGAVDLAIGVFPDPPPDAVSTPLFEERFVGLARVGHPALAGGAMTLDAFCDAPHALVTTRRDVSGAVDAALATLGRRRRVALALPHMLALPHVLRAGEMLAAMPVRLVAALPPGEGLVRFDLPVAVPSWTVAMLWPAVARGDPAAAWLRRLIRAAAATPA